MKTTVKPVLNWCLAATAGLLLAGCSATHVGESWQCSLAQGTSCTTIAEADPAVPAGVARQAMLFGEPLPGARRQVDGTVTVGRRDAGEACDGGCGLAAWLKGLFGSDTAADAASYSPAVPATVAATEPAATSAPAPAASLRVPEVLGRIWIAPFVDAAGIYREAHWVRVVLEPAGWKLP